MREVVPGPPRGAVRRSAGNSGRANRGAMQKLRWDPCLETGIEEIDWEHRRLLNIVNRLLDAMARGKGEAAVRPVSRDLARHAEEHFGHEEQYMRDMDYPDLDGHVAEHRELTRSLTQFVEGLDSDTPPGARELAALMSHWLLDHILRCDKAYAMFSRERAGKGPCR